MRNFLMRATTAATLFSALLVLPNTSRAGWGIDSGRANEGDAVTLLSDQLALKRGYNRISSILSGYILSAKNDKNADIQLAAEVVRLHDDWVKEVIRPGEAIAGNPAASCVEARVPISIIFGAMRQRQLLGLVPGEKDFSNAAGTLREQEYELSELLYSLTEKVRQRCRDEALDECNMTGRFIQIPTLALGETRQDQLGCKPTEGDSEAWANAALKECAIYELHFVSTTKVGSAQIFNIETVRDGKIPIKFDAPSGDIMAALMAAPGERKKLGEILKGETSGSVNPFFVSIKCSQPPLEVTCSPGAASDPVRSGITTLDLSYREFFLDPNGNSKVRVVGEDRFSFEFAGGIFSLQALIKIPNGGVYPMPFRRWVSASTLLIRRTGWEKGLEKGPR